MKNRVTFAQSPRARNTLYLPAQWGVSDAHHVVWRWNFADGLRWRWPRIHAPLLASLAALLFAATVPIDRDKANDAHRVEEPPAWRNPPGGLVSKNGAFCDSA